MPKLRRVQTAPEGALTGPLRHVRRDSDLSALRQGDVALVQMPELDARQAQELLDQGVVAVLNGSASSSGRVPNQGPSILTRGGVALIDIGDSDPFGLFKNGETVHVLDGQVLRDGVPVTAGERLDESRTTSVLADAESTMSTRLDSLAANATDHIHREQAMLLDGARVPHLRTSLRRRPVVVVSKAYDAKTDLKSLKRFIAGNDPVLIGAGPGADLLLDSGYTPDILVGALENLTDRAIGAAGEVVVTTASGQIPGHERLERHGKQIVTFVSSGNDDDLAILLADTNHAGVIVHVGGPPSLTEFLERSPDEVARMFVARLRAGSKIVDAKSVNQLSARPLSWWPVLLLVLVGLLAVGVAITVTPLGQDWFDRLGDAVSGSGTWIKGLMS